MNLKTLFFSLAVLVLTAAPRFASAQELINPLGTTDLRIVAGNLIKALLGFTGIIALAMFIYGGVIWMTSAGKKESVQKGRDTLIWAAIGLVVIFTAYTVVTALITAIATGSVPATG